ncbi:mitochondrial ribosomal protein L30 [Halictus rubicundus]|uniref:mitochondrial ribosomal protein L30 n=1 Tax=Halictus rubicundus TaxID=77578 RepID=UPI004035E4C2
MANRPTSVLLSFVRHRHRNLRAWKDDMVKYDYIEYYPSKKDHVDPPVTPAKVFMVFRVKPFKGNPWWEKDTLLQIGLQERGNEPTFLKNTPEMCRLLWKIKHLIKIVPVKLSDKPFNVNDSTEYYIDDNGTVHIGGKLDPARVEATESFKNSMKRLDNATISEKLRLQWVKGLLI